MAANKRRRTTYRREGPVTQAEKDLIAKVVSDSPRELKQGQINGLAQALRRSRETIKALVEEARDTFVERSKRYVDIHMEAAEKALADGSAKALEQAVKASQWAMENLSAEGARIIDRPTDQAGGHKILIGIKVGGVSETSVESK